MLRVLILFFSQINKIVPTVTYHPHFRPQDDDQMQADKLSVRTFARVSFRGGVGGGIRPLGS